MKKLIPLPKLKKRLWKLFSEYIRRKNADDFGVVRCITCRVYLHWKEIHAGHYEKRTYLALCFDERNVHPQCPRCNLWLNGNQSEYALALRRKYGETILEDLSAVKNSRDKFSRMEYEEMISDYKKKLKELS